MIRSVVFDVDGVLVRSGVFAQQLQVRYGLGVEQTSDFFQGPFADCVLGHADLKESILPFLSKWKWPGTLEELLTFWFESDSATNGEVLPIARALRSSGYGTYVASTQEQYRVAYLETELKLAEYFDQLFFSCRVGSKKPDRAFYDHIAERIGSKPREILFFDDHPPNVEGAKDAGWNAELYQFGDDMNALLAAYQVRSSL